MENFPSQMYPRSQPSRQLCPPLSSHWGTMIPLRILIFTYVMLPWIVSSAAKGEYMEARTPAVRKLWGEVQNYLQGRYAQKWELTEMISSFCRKLRYVRRTMASCKTQILMVEYFQKQKVRFIKKKKKSFPQLFQSWLCNTCKGILPHFCEWS